MKRILMYSMAAFLLSMSVFMGASAFGSSSGDEPCVPKAAYDTVVHHDAVIHVVHHDAVTHDEKTADQRYSWNPKGPQNETDGPGPGSTPLTDPDHWQANTSHYNGTDPLDEVFQEGHGNGGDNASWFYWTSKTVTITDHEAFDETVVDKEAYDETVHHDAVTCGTPTPTPTPTPEPTLGPAPTFEPGPTDTVKPVIPTVVHAGMEGLPNTGGPNWWLFGAGAVLLALGFGLAALGKRIGK